MEGRCVFGGMGGIGLWMSCRGGLGGWGAVFFCDALDWVFCRVSIGVAASLAVACFFWVLGLIQRCATEYTAVANKLE